MRKNNEQLIKLYKHVLLCDTCTYTCILHSEGTDTMHTLMHMYTQSHTHAHSTHKHVHAHTTMCKQDGHCPLYTASQEGHDRIVDLLLQAGATVDLQDKVEYCSSVTCGVPCAVFIVH